MERIERYPLHRRATSHSFGSPYLHHSSPRNPSPPPSSFSLDATPRRSPRAFPLHLPLTFSIGDTATTYSLVPIPPTPSSPSPSSSPLSHLCSPLRCLLSLACVLTVVPVYLLLSARHPPAASPLSVFPPSALVPVTYAINRTVLPLLPYPPTWQRPSEFLSPSSPLLFSLPSSLSPALSPPALTILTLLRPMTPSSLLTSPSVYHAQLLAVTSYLALTPHVIAYADSPSTCRHLSHLLPRLSCRPLPPSCQPPPYRRPTLDCILGRPTSTPFTAYVNADVALHPLLLSHLRFLASTLDRFAAVARRTDPSFPVVSSPSLNLSSLWPETGADGGSLHSDWGVDIFVLPSSPPLPLTFPPFLAGVYRWDNDLLAQLLSLREVEVVDISSLGLTLHLGGAAGGAGGVGVAEEHGTRKGAEWNERLSREAGNRWKVGRTANAPWALPCAPLSPSLPSSASSADPEAPRACELEWRGEGSEVQYLRAARDGWVLLFHVRADADLPVFFHFLCTMQAQRRGFLVLSALPLPSHPALAGRVVVSGRAAAAVVYDLLAYDYNVLYLTADALYLSFPSALGPSQGGPGSVHAPTEGCEALVVRAGLVSMRAFHAAAACEGETLCDCLQEVSQGQEEDGEGFVLEEDLGSHQGAVSVVIRPADTEAEELMSGWRWWAGEGLMANDNGGPHCLPDFIARPPPPATLPFHFHVRAEAGESDAVLLLLESTSALTVDEGEEVHLTLEVDAPSPQLQSHLAAFRWPHGRLTITKAGDGVRGEGDGEEAYHVVMTAAHLAGERTMPLLRAFVSRWVQEDAGHPRLLGVTLSSNTSEPVSAFSFHQTPSPHSYLLLPGAAADSLRPIAAWIRAEGLLFVQPPSAWQPLQHTRGPRERAERTDGQVEEWRLPRVDSMHGVDMEGRPVWSAWELRNRGRWPAL